MGYLHKFCDLAQPAGHGTTAQLHGPLCRGLTAHEQHFASCDSLMLPVQEHHVKFEKYKMQDALIQEEEEGQRLDKNKAAAKAAADREKKQRKKVRQAMRSFVWRLWCFPF